MTLNAVLQSRGSRWNRLKIILDMAKGGGRGSKGNDESGQLSVSLTSLLFPVQIFEGGYHCLHHDLPEVAESVLKDVSGWISERLPAEPSQQP